MSTPAVTMHVMLAVNCKRTSSVDLHRPIKNYIRSHFSERDAVDAEDDLQSVQAMRREIERGSSESLDSRREVLLKYSRALTVMASRFPIAPDVQHLSAITFPWFDAFQPSKKASQCNIHFERASVCFNLAATLSQIALAADRSSPAGLKTAFNAFQQSAGAFLFLKEHLSGKALMGVGGTCTVDVGGECAGMLERFMLGQAQECFYEKALADGKPKGICARIAQQAAMFYEEAHAALLLPPLSSHSDKQWVANVSFKAKHFHAEALYRWSLDLHEKEEIAEEIARLTHARTILQDAKKASRGVMQPMLDSVTRLEGLVGACLKRAEAENDRVYLFRVPAFASLPPIPPAVMARAEGIEGMMDATGERLFAGLVPDGSAKDMSRYTDMVDGVIRKQVDLMQQASDRAKQRVRDLQLPDLLLALDGDTAPFIPTKLREDVEAVMVSGGPAGLPSELAQLQDLRRVNEELLVAAEEALEGEAREDAGMRAQFGGRWARPQSSTLSKSLKERAAAFAGNLKQARESDGRIERDVREAGEVMGVLGHSRLEDALPRISRPMLAVHGDEQAIVGTLRQLLGELERVGAQRAGLEDMLREMKRKDDILPKLMNAPGSQDALFARELSKYDPVCRQVEENVQQQNRVMGKLEAQHHLFSLTFNIPEYKVSLSKTLSRLQSAVSKYQELRANMNEGLKFYVALQDAITSLKQQCTDFVMTRNIQKSDLINDLQRQLSGLNFSDNTAAAANTAARGNYPPTQPQQPAAPRSPQRAQPVAAARPTSPKPSGAFGFIQSLPFFNQNHQQQQQQPAQPAPPYVPAPLSHQHQQQQQPPPGYYAPAPPAQAGSHPGGAPAGAPYYMPQQQQQQQPGVPPQPYYSQPGPGAAPAAAAAAGAGGQYMGMYGAGGVEQQQSGQWGGGGGGYHPQAYGQQQGPPAAMPPPNQYQQYPPPRGY